MKSIPFDESLSKSDIEFLLKDYKKITDNNDIKNYDKYTILRYFLYKKDKYLFRLGGLLLSIVGNIVYVKKFKGMIEKVPLNNTIFYVKKTVNKNKYRDIIDKNNQIIKMLGGEYKEHSNLDEILNNIEYFEPTIELENKIKNKFPELDKYSLINTYDLKVKDIIRTVSLDFNKCTAPGVVIEIEKDEGVIKIVRLTSSYDVENKIYWEMKPNNYFLFRITSLSELLKREYLTK